MKGDEHVYPFAIVPVEVFMDTRLTLETMRVLGTLFSFRNKVTGLTFPSREKIAARCGMHPSNISAATTKLVELGWLIKKGKGGYSKPTSYEINVPEIVAQFAALHKARSDAREAEKKSSKVAEQDTVAQSATIAEQAIPTCSPIGYLTVAQQAIRKGSPTGYTQRTDQLTNQLTDQKATDIPLPDKSGEKNPYLEDELQSTCRTTWKSYADAYFTRYGVEPVRNAVINTHIKAFCKKIPHLEAPHVAAFYVRHNDKYYLQKTHHPSLMSKDAEGLRTQWATGRSMTSTKATQLEKTSGNADAVKEAIEMMNARRAHATL